MSDRTPDLISPDVQNTNKHLPQARHQDALDIPQESTEEVLRELHFTRHLKQPFFTHFFTHTVSKDRKRNAFNYCVHYRE